MAVSAMDATVRLALWAHGMRKRPRSPLIRSSDADWARISELAAACGSSARYRAHPPAG